MLCISVLALFNVSFAFVLHKYIIDKKHMDPRRGRGVDQVVSIMRSDSRNL